MSEKRPDSWDAREADCVAGLAVRDMRGSDITEVVHIERHAQLSPWSRLSFEESLNKGNLCRVIEHHSKLVAYHISSKVVDELHVLNVVVSPVAQGTGLGHRLLHDILEVARNEGLKKIFLEVRASNRIAQNLYQKWQFKQIAVRKRYYQPVASQPLGQRENALIFLRQL